MDTWTIIGIVVIAILVTVTILLAWTAFWPGRLSRADRTHARFLFAYWCLILLWMGIGELYRDGYLPKWSAWMSGAAVIAASAYWILIQFRRASKAESGAPAEDK